MPQHAFWGPKKFGFCNSKDKITNRIGRLCNEETLVPCCNLDDTLNARLDDDVREQTDQHATSMAIRAKHVKSSKNVSRQVDLRKNKLVFNIPKTMQICHPQSGRQAGKAHHHPCLFVFLQVSLEQTSPSWKKRNVSSTVVSCLYLWYLLHWPLSWSTSENKLLSIFFDDNVWQINALKWWCHWFSYYLPGKHFPWRDKNTQRCCCCCCPFMLALNSHFILNFDI